MRKFLSLLGLCKRAGKLAAGEVADLKQAREIVAASFELKHYQPSPERDMWDEAYARFCALN